MTALTPRQELAARYEAKGIAVCPLGLDGYGQPKQRLDRYASRFRPKDNTSHDWDRPEVKGIAIVLGPPSGNLAVIDIDDRGLADYLLTWLSSLEEPPLMCRTPHGLHIYVREPHPSQWAHLTAKYNGRECDIDILCAGNVSAIPTTRGYAWLNNKELAAPAYGRVLKVWNDISIQCPLGLPYRQGRARKGNGHWSPSPSIDQVRKAMLDVGN